MTGQARITIELEPPTRHRERWIARTRVEQPERSGLLEGGPAEGAPMAYPRLEPTRMESAPIQPVVAPEQREPAVVPVGYEPPTDCTCLDGFCDADHANE